MTMEPGSVFADLHIHSRYSRATSGELTIPLIYRWAQIKGISLVGTGDFTHPAWMNEIRDSLVERGDGILTALASADPARPFSDLAREAIAVAGLVPPSRQFSAILSLAGDINCGDAGPRLRLLSEVDAFALNPERVRLLTMHASKGLEFDNVFVAGLNDGTVPLVSGHDLDEDEERRLLFVAVTRARRRLFLSWAARGRSGEPCISRFLRGKIPVESLTAVGEVSPRPVQQRLL